MQNACALAELQWPSELKSAPTAGRLRTPAQPGEAVTVPVMPLVPEAGGVLLKLKVQFRLFSGPGLFAYGRVVSVVQASEDDLKRVFHFC